MIDKPDLKVLTGARGIAAWLVVLFHIRLSIAGLPADWAGVLAKGYLAVDFFFLLSGFVIWLAWGERLRLLGWGAVPGFLQRRIARIWPLHAFILACAVVLALVMLATGRHDGGDYPFHALGLHFLLLHNWGITDQLAWNDPSWSISAELGAYLMFPVLTAAIDWRRVPAWAIIATVGALILLLHATMAAAGAITLGADIPRFGLLRCVIEFAAGTAIAALWLRWRARPWPAIIAISAICALAMAGWASGLPETLMVPGAFAALLLALGLTAGMRGNPLETRVLHWLGEISYATYLGHYMLWIVFKLLFVSDARAVPAEMIALYLGAVLISSALLYRFVEKPAQAWMNGLRLAPKRRRPGLGARGIRP